MAIVLPTLADIRPIAGMFDKLGQASSLHVNIGKTIIIPLYPSTNLQCRKDISHTPWAGMGINIGCGKYLGFLVGPGANANNNYEAVMEKIRVKAAFLAGCTQVGSVLSNLWL